MCPRKGDIEDCASVAGVFMTTLKLVKRTKPLVRKRRRETSSAFDMHGLITVVISRAGASVPGPERATAV